MDCYFNNHSTKTKVHLRSRSLGKRNYKLTKKLQQKMEREQQIPENFYEEFITSDIDEDRQLERKFERYQPNYFEKLNETNILLGSKCKITHYSERPGTGANIPSPQQIKQKQQQATSQNQLLQEQRNTQSLPGASIGSSSVKAKNPKFVVHNDGILSLKFHENLEKRILQNNCYKNQEIIFVYQIIKLSQIYIYIDLQINK